MANLNNLENFEQFKELLASFGDDFSKTPSIYHYTSAEGLSGIIQNNEIWLTNTEFVNDPTEHKMLIEENGLLRNIDSKNEYVKKQLELSLRPKQNLNNHYIASFSKIPDSLEQWRSYGHFCIGFDTKKLTGNNFIQSNCIYDERKMKDWILEKEKSWPNFGDQEDFKKVAAFNLVFLASIKYKNSNYANEKEVRLTTISDHDWRGYDRSPEMFSTQQPIHFRIHPQLNTTIPYVKFYLSEPCNKKHNDVTKEQMRQRKLEYEQKVVKQPLPINKIIIGPTTHQEEKKAAIRILLCENGYNRVPVEISDIPYRGF